MELLELWRSEIDTECAVELTKLWKHEIDAFPNGIMDGNVLILDALDGLPPCSTSACDFNGIVCFFNEKQ